MDLPKHYLPADVEKKWQTFWQKKQIYAFDTKSKKDVYSIDTPPPYASADHLHVGHGMHYSQFEFIARYQRMNGKNVFFPMGYDDNGLPTERYIEKKYKITDKTSISRKEFIALCLEETKKAGQTYYELFTALGFSIDWNLLYQTIGERARRVGQKSFLDLHKKGRMERSDFPTVWCTHCQTTIAQADLDNMDLDSYFNDIAFSSGAKSLVISTTRPELLPACVALFYHPQDKRYASLKGKKARVPLFEYEVPLLSDEDVDPEKGTGLMMVCTFGDKEDIEKWQKHHLDLRVVLKENGTLNSLAASYEGLRLKEARKKILDELKKKGFLVSQKTVTHSVNVHERCGTEVEFLKKSQWQILLLDKKKELIAQGEKVQWYPDHMRVRYEHWVKNLQWNWVISRQRHYGVPFPVWYCDACAAILVADEKDLPVDPREESYKGKCSCGSSQISGEMDVMDTWMISSCTPEINMDWGGKERKNFLPMSLRPQAHDIIRTWAFYTLVKSYYHHGTIPWKYIMISGHGQDPYGKKMSKSKGNFIVAQEMISKYSADAFRFWAASAKLGEDLPFQEKELVTGQKTITKLWNASKFCFLHLEEYDGKKKPKTLEAFDQWMLLRLNELVEQCKNAFDVYDYSKARFLVDQFFLKIFCDQYLELVKDRLYNPDRRGKNARLSAQYTLYTNLYILLQLFAPLLPFITEELYSLFFKKFIEEKSIHLTQWPSYKKALFDKVLDKQGEDLLKIISLIRQEKTKKSLAMKDSIKKLVVPSSLKVFADDLKEVAHAEILDYGEFSVEF